MEKVRCSAILAMRFAASGARSAVSMAASYSALNCAQQGQQREGFHQLCRRPASCMGHARSSHSMTRFT